MKIYKKNFLKFYKLTTQDRLMCWNCGEKESVDLHHIIFNHKDKSDEVHNLIPLCRGENCHNNSHSGLREQADKFLQIVQQKMKEMTKLGYLTETMQGL